MTREELEALKQELRERGVRENSVEWQRAINLAFASNNGRGYSANETRDRLNMPQGLRADTSKDDLLGILWVLKNYMRYGKLFNDTSHRVNESAGRALQNYLISRGYDLRYKRSDGSIGIENDGRIGDRTFAALSLEITTLKGAEGSEYETDFRNEYGTAPTYNKVAGRNPMETLVTANMLYNYYKLNPELYAGLLLDNVLAALILPYLSEEAKSLLSKTAMEGYLRKDVNGNPTGQVLDIPEMAYQGLLGPRGVLLLQGWEQANVASAKDRGLLDIILVIGGDILGAGLKVMGQTIGHLVGQGDLEKAGGLTYGWTYNPVTRLMLKVAIPNETITVADAAGRAAYGVSPFEDPEHPIAGPIAGVAINTVTDPLSIFSTLATMKRTPTKYSSYRTARVPGSGYKGYLVNVNKGMPLEGGMGEVGVLSEVSPETVIPGLPTTTYTINTVETAPGKTIPGKPKYHIEGNRVNGVGPRKSGGVNKTIATSDPTSIYVPPTYETTVDGVTVMGPDTHIGPVYDYLRFPYTVLNIEGTVTPYYAWRPSLDAYATVTIPGTTSINPVLWPAAYGSYGVTQRPNTVSSLPVDDYYIGTYEDMPVGRDFVVEDLDLPEYLRLPSANTHNTFRSRQSPLRVYINKYGMPEWRVESLLGLHKKGGTLKKRCKR